MTQQPPSNPSQPIRITRPLLPAVDELVPLLEEILESGWVTNHGRFVQAFETALRRRLGVEHLAVVTNGTLALELALRALNLKGEVITTGFTFPATYHTLFNLSGVTPVFADIGSDYTLDPESVRAKVTPRTRAILAVHSYGYPCRVDALARIAEEHDLHLVYDAAPAFGVALDERPIGTYGDLSTFSFHAAKVFSTLEGGCVVARSSEHLAQVALMRNFGIANEESVSLAGLNAKMDEVRAAIGLVTIKRVEEVVAARKRIVERYLEAFHRETDGDVAIRYELYQHPDISLNYAYFPVLVRPGGHVTRDTLFTALRSAGIEARKYYYPSVVHVPMYRGYIVPEELTMTRYAAENVLCLPVHHEMSDADCDRVIEVFVHAYRQGV